MDILDIKSLYKAHPNINATLARLNMDAVHPIFLTGLGGSGKAVVTASVFEQRKGVFLCILNDPDDAGYFYNDLMQLMNGENVYFFPSAYRRHIKYGHTDPAN